MIRTIKPEAANIRTNAGKAIQSSPVIITNDGYDPPIQRLRTNAGKAIQVTPSQQIIEVVRPELMRVGGKPRGSGSGGAIADKNPIIFEFNNNLSNTGTDAWAARFLDPSGFNLSYSTTAKTGTHSASFNGSNSYIGLSSITNDFFGLGNDNFSFELDLQFAGLSSSRTIFAKHVFNGTANNYSFMLLYADTVNKLVWVKNGIYTTISSTIDTTLNTWHNLKISRKENTTFFYWNNALAGTFDETVSMNGSVAYRTNNTQFRIGSNGENVWWFNGLIDNFKFYKRAII